MSGSLIGEIGGGTLLLLGIVVAIVAAVFGGAVRGVFGVALYYYVAEDREVGRLRLLSWQAQPAQGRRALREVSYGLIVAILLLRPRFRRS